MTQVPVLASEEKVKSQESVAAAICTFQRFRKDKQKTAHTRLRHFCSDFNTTLVANFFEYPLKPSFFAPSASLPPSSSSLSGSAPLCSSARFRFLIAASVMVVLGDDYDETQEINGMVMEKLHSESKETLRKNKTRKVTRQEHRKARAQALVLQDSFPSPLASQADELDEYHLRENLETVPLSVLESFFGR